VPDSDANCESELNVKTVTANTWCRHL